MNHLVRWTLTAVNLILCEVAVGQSTTTIPEDGTLCQTLSAFGSDSMTMLFDAHRSSEIRTKKELDSYHEFLRDGVRSAIFGKQNYYQKTLNLSENDYNSSVLSLDEMKYISAHELIVTGEVLSKRSNPNDQCKFFKTTYLIKVEDIVFSLFDSIQVGDTIVLKSKDGVIGEGCLGSPSNLSVMSSHFTPYSIGQTKMFCLSNVNYYISAIGARLIEKEIVYQDPLCPSFFTNLESNMLENDFLKIPEIQQFLEWFYHH